MRTATLYKLADFAGDQWGLITRWQAEAAGVSSTTLERLTAPGGSLERVAFGVYRLVGAPIPEHMDLRAAWLQLDPATPAWTRTAAQGVVSHRSAAVAYGFGHLAADIHEFTLPTRKQTRRRDVRLHIRPVRDAEWISLGGLPVTRPSRIVSDLLREHEDPEAVAQIVADAIRGGFDYPGTFAHPLAHYARSLGFRHDDGVAVLDWLLSLVGDRDAERWMSEARRATASNAATGGAAG